MTVPRQPDPPAASPVVVRPYDDGDYDACRSLWAQLTTYHRGIYGDPSIGGDDPGAGLDDYLAEPRRTGSWVAESDARVIGLTGLLDHGPSGEVEPVVTAVRRFHAAGFTALGGHVDLTMDLAPRRHDWLPGASLHGRDFDY